MAFHEANISDVDLTSGAGEATLLNEGVGVASDASFTTSTSLLDQYIQGIRDALGVELQASGTRADVGTGDIGGNHKLSSVRRTPIQSANRNS